MKRMLALLCALILCLSLFASCGGEKEIDNSTDAPSEEEENEEKTDEKKETNTFLQAPQPPADYQPTYEVLMLGGTERLNYKAEYEIRQDGYSKFKAPKSVEIILDGEKVTVTGGGKPKYRYDEFYPIYWYHVPNTEIDIEIDVFGNVVSYQNEDVQCYESEAKLKDEEYEQIALDFLSNFMDVSGCEILSSAANTTWDAYYVKFAQYVNGMETSGHGSIELAYDGQVKSYVAYNINQISKDTKNPFDMEKVKQIAEEYITAKTAKKAQKYDVVNYTYDYKLTMLQEGTLAILCEVDVDFIVDYGVMWSDEGGRVEFLIR